KHYQIQVPGGKKPHAQKNTGRDRMEFLHSRNELGVVDPLGQEKAYAQRAAMLKQETTKLAGVANRFAWENLGPGNIAGRTRALLTHPNNNNILWLATTRGGIWKSVDGGANWSPTSDGVAPNTVTCLVMHPSNPDIIYACTGEGFRASRRGAGILVSYNGGASWAKLGGINTFSGTQWQYTNRLVVLPQDPNIILAATRQGIYRSSDAGNNFALVSAGEYADLKLDPNNNQRLIAGQFGGKISYSSNAGATFTTLTIATPTTAFAAGSKDSGRVELAYSPSQSNVVYASVDNNLGELYVSSNGGVNWLLRSTPAHLQTQGGYDNALWVHPKNPNVILLGGIRAHRSFDAGATFSSFDTATSSKGSNGFGATIHADHHGFFGATGIGISNQMVYGVNDGGVWVNYDVTVPYAAGNSNNYWRNLNNGLAASQGYGIAVSKKRGLILSGTQDTGLLGQRSNTDNFYQWQEYSFGGDYFSPQIDDSSNLSYATVYNLLVYRMSGDTAGAVGATSLCYNLPDAPNANGRCSSTADNEKANFDAPIKLDPHDMNRLYAGGASLWVSNSIRQSANLVTWKEIKPALSGSSNDGNYISAIEVHPTDPNIVMVGHNNGEVFVSKNATAAAPVWRQLTGIPARLVEGFYVDASDRNILYIMLGGFSSGNLLKTTFSEPQAGPFVVGAGQLPDINVYALTQHPKKPEWMYAGTAAGFFTSTDAGNSWSTNNDGPSAASIVSMSWWDDTTLMVSAYGRGVWRAAISVDAGESTVYELFHAGNQRYFRTSSKQEMLDLSTNASSGWVRTFDDFVAWDLKQSASITAPMCRFNYFDSGLNSHFYLMGVKACNDFRAQEEQNPKGWRFESYEFVLTQAFFPTATGCPTSAPIPLYRVYNNGYKAPPAVNNSHHRFTTKASEVAKHVAAGWTSEGVVACAIRTAP
ncbi:MAG: hypothetical protein RLZZ502_191, partial [Pseudomonadota bacterium]